jgi:molecular chaperone GrpE
MIARKTKQGRQNMAQDNPSPENSAIDEIEEFIEAEELDALRAERDELRDRFMRALADAENARKRADRDRREAEQYGSTRLARDLLPVFDNLKRALEAATDDTRSQASALIEGVELTLRELTNVMTKHGMTPISPAPGDAFDPQLHQAMFEAPVPGTKAGHIIQVMTDGFMLHDRLLRPAQVGVSSMSAS